MSEGTSLNSQSDADQLETAVDQAIAACGDTRAAMRALIMANGYLRSEKNERLSRAVSFAFMRSPLSPDRKDWYD